MTRRRDIERRLHSFGDIHKILGSMRNLSYLEIRKLTQFLSSQRRVVESIDRAAYDFLGFFPGLLSEPQSASPVFVLIGSERGFCGDFNELLLRSLAPRRDQERQPLLVCVGQKLAAALAGDPRLVTALEGPSVAEEVGDVLLKLVAALNRHEAASGPISLRAVYHDAAVEGVKTVSVLPPFQEPRETPYYAYPPRLNLAPQAFVAELVDQHLFAALYEIFYTSLMAEQQFRIRHLEGAMKRLDEKMAALTLARNTLRQEEIIEEIEVILLSAG